MRLRKQKAFSLVEMIIAISIIALFGGLVATNIIQTYRNHQIAEAQSITQRDLNLMIDRVSRVLRSTTLILETTETGLKVRGYPKVNDPAPSEIYFYIENSALKYSVIPPTGTAPNYTYDPNDAQYFTLLPKVTNSVANPLWRYYDENSDLLAFPVNKADVRIVETLPFALDSGNALSAPIGISTKIALRNFKTNL
ncbi:MAG: type II secretion system protein [Candidatus Berkelbacteria bacterium]|nr:MAG: type II secretion system protein [Candidatus Berkelbacteria bacterium]QQG51583.1 MAG: type II secretion system protein [Candidatus Berkelbacteria bacterium]